MPILVKTGLVSEDREQKTDNRKAAVTEISGCSAKKICYNKIRERRIKRYGRKQENKSRCNPERFLETK